MPPSNPRLQVHLISDLPKAEALLTDLRRIDAARRYSNFGPLALEFEAGVLERLSARDPTPHYGPIHLLSLSTCYHALEIGLRLLGAGPGKTVLIPGVTFPACPLAVQHTGATAVLGDIDGDSWVLTPEQARQIAAKTTIDCVMPVALYGVPLPVEPWNAFSRDTGIPVIMDAAAAVGSQGVLEKGLIAHSLHATKPFGVGEGGILVGRDAGLIERARLASNFGTTMRIAYEDGINAKLSEYHAAVGLAQLRRWDAIVDQRAKLRQIYQRELKKLGSAVRLQPGIDTTVVSCLMLRLDRPIAEEVTAKAVTHAIACHRTYLPPLYRHPYFTKLARATVDGLQHAAATLPACEIMDQHVLGVPFHPFLTEEDIVTVVDRLGKILK